MCHGEPHASSINEVSGKLQPMPWLKALTKLTVNQENMQNEMHQPCNNQLPVFSSSPVPGALPFVPGQVLVQASGSKPSIDCQSIKHHCPKYPPKMTNGCGLMAVFLCRQPLCHHLLQGTAKVSPESVMQGTRIMSESSSMTRRASSNPRRQEDCR